MKKRMKVLCGLGGILLGLYLFNTSRFAPPAAHELTLLSHRGVHQSFDFEGVENDTCTAKLIHKPVHDFIENTLPSMQAAFAAGADIIELDIHPTSDGNFVVFHDWTLDCRTDGSGVTREHNLGYLKTLDIGYGYTADDAQSFPFRGKFVGAMPTLGEVLDAFPRRFFDINIKSHSALEAETIITYLNARGYEDWGRLSFNGHERPVSILKRHQPDLATYSKQAAKACFKGYILTGWAGYMAKACHRVILPVPANFRYFLWGWPHKFEARLNRVGSRSMLMGPYSGKFTTGIDSLGDMVYVPQNYSGLIRTNKIDVIGPHIKTQS